MPTPFLCDHCQLRGTSFQESGRGVTIAPEADEVVRFFHLDTEMFRNQYGLQERGVCDLLVAYRRETGGAVDLFTELKGAGGCGHAVRQIECAFVALQTELRASQQGVTFRALVVTASSAPPNRKDLARQLTKVGMSDVRFKTGVKRGTNVDIRQFVT